MAQTTIDGGGPGGSFVDGASVVDEVVMEALRGNIPDAESRLTALEALAPSGLAPILKASVTLNNTQIKALPTTAVTLIAAPGANTRINLIHLELFANFVAGGYTNVNGSQAWLTCKMNGTDVTSYLVQDPTVLLYSFYNFFTTASKQSAPFTRWTEVESSWGSLSFPEATDFINKALEIYVDNGSLGDFTGGNVLNTIKARAFYTLETD